MMIAFYCTRLWDLTRIIHSVLTCSLTSNPEFLLLSIVTSASEAMSTKVQDLRIGLNKSTTRLVIELDQKIEPTSIWFSKSLSYSYRFTCRSNLHLPNQRLSIRGGVIDRLRYGAFKPGSSRLVLDLNTSAKVSKKFILSPDLNNNWRLVIDLVTH